MISCLLCTSGVAEEIPKGPRQVVIPDQVNVYYRELILAQNNPKASKGIEELLRLGRAASDALVRPTIPGKSDILESLSEKEYQEVIHKMVGFSVNREETVFVEPNPSFFIDLAKHSGDQASIDYFETYKKTNLVYVSQQTDYNGCYLFGTLSMVDSFSQWKNYSQKYPNRYQKEVLNSLKEIEDDITSGTCACGDKQSALREFEAFVKLYPNEKITKRIRERVEQIHRGESDIRENCINQ